MQLEKPPSVLVMDDDPDLRMLLEMVLSPLAPRVLSAGDADAALGLARAQRPDVAVLDVMIPGSLDGLGVCRKIKAEMPGCFVVIVSGRSLESDLLDAERSGADAYFVKPVSMLELGALIESALAGVRVLRPVAAPRRHLLPQILPE